MSVGEVGLAAPEAQAEAWLLFPGRCSDRALEQAGGPSEKALWVWLAESWGHRAKLADHLRAALETMWSQHRSCGGRDVSWDATGPGTPILLSLILLIYSLREEVP